MKKIITRSIVCGSVAVISSLAAGGGALQAAGFQGEDNVAVIIASSPSLPPAGIKKEKRTDGGPARIAGDVVIEGVPAYKWSYGSSATAAAMIAAYYDRTGLPDMYGGPTNGGCMPLTNTVWGENECPLSATKNGLDGRLTRGHVDDYYVSEGDDGPDPYATNSWAEHVAGDCTGDFMKTSKWFAGSSSKPAFSADINKDGAAVFIVKTTGEAVDADYLENNYDYHLYDGGYGLKEFYESRGYHVSEMFNQVLDVADGVTAGQGFTFADYRSEIDAGRPVLIHLASGAGAHVSVGTGYNTAGDTVIFHDAWDHDEHRVSWGGIYNTVYKLNAVTIVRISDEPDSGASCGKFTWSMFLPAMTGVGR